MSKERRIKEIHIKVSEETLKFIGLVSGIIAILLYVLCFATGNGIYTFFGLCGTGLQYTAYHYNSKLFPDGD